MEVSNEIPEPVKTKCDQLKTKIKSRRGSVKKEVTFFIELFDCTINKRDVIQKNLTEINFLRA